MLILKHFKLKKRQTEKDFRQTARRANNEWATSSRDRQRDNECVVFVKEDRMVCCLRSTFVIASRLEKRLSKNHSAVKLHVQILWKTKC